MKTGDPEFDPVRSGFRVRYRLLVGCFLEWEGWTVDRLLASNRPQAEAERRVRAAEAAGQ